MVKISLSFWDIAGQERFEFFKTDFFAGTAAVGLVFDLARPDTFEKLDAYFEEIRERAGNVPIILVGNKNDLKAEIGETVVREKIIQKVNQYNLFEYIETSALKNVNVDELFNRLSITALMVSLIVSLTVSLEDAGSVLLGILCTSMNFATASFIISWTSFGNSSSG
ncbi:unnamed protein product, partial [marine sediment metagenome]